MAIWECWIDARAGQISFLSPWTMQEKLNLLTSNSNRFTITFLWMQTRDVRLASCLARTGQWKENDVSRDEIGGLYCVRYSRPVHTAGLLYVRAFHWAFHSLYTTCCTVDMMTTLELNQLTKLLLTHWINVLHSLQDCLLFYLIYHHRFYFFSFSCSIVLIFTYF